MGNVAGRLKNPVHLKKRQGRIGKLLNRYRGRTLQQERNGLQLLRCFEDASDLEYNIYIYIYIFIYIYI